MSESQISGEADLPGFVAISACGLLLSVYALYVEIRKSTDREYVAACDLSDSMSCSRVVTSRSVSLTRI